MSKQATSALLMIEPVAFRFNHQTAENNYFQENLDREDDTLQDRALAEFLNMVEQLRFVGVEVITLKDTLKPHTPDSIFPNNWMLLHHDGRVGLFPMYAPNRRAERRTDLFDVLKINGFQLKEVFDYTSKEKNGRYLESTGSIIFDHDYKVAYAALSERTDKDLFFQFCEDFGYQPMYFTSNQTVGNERLPIYHTNVMMCMADQFVVICLDTIDDEDELERLKEIFANTNKQVIAISEQQMHQFAGNMLQVRGSNSNYLVMSQSAYDSLHPTQIELIEQYQPILSIPIPTIETVGGGSVRCMMAEIFLPKQ